MRILGPALLALVVLASSSGCADDDPPAASAPDYSASLQAPARTDFTPSEVSPGAEDGLAELTLDDGARVVLWIDPDAITDVVVQHSDPTDPDGPDSWTAPRTIFRAGDGCLDLGAATDGEVVAVGLGCYASDTFVQQAPDQGVALVSTDLVTWETSEDLGEFSCSAPEVAPDGEVRFTNDVNPDQAVLWTADDGFSRQG